MKAAKQKPAYFQRSEECSEVSSRSIIHSTVEKSAITNSKPNDNTPILIDTTHHDMKINMTPNRKTSRDNSNTPVPRSMNGSFVSTQPKQASLQTEKPNLNVGSSTGIKEPTGSIQTIKIMTNMETILETIVTEMHQLKEDQLEFKKEVKQQISSIKDKQQEDGKSVSNLSKAVKEDIRSCIVKIDQMGENSKKEQIVTNSHDELKTVVLDLQKKVDSRLDSTSTNIQKLETSITSAWSSMNKLSRDCTTEFHNLKSKNTQMSETVMEIQTDIKRTGHTLIDVEKSLTAISESDEFTRPSRQANESTEAAEIMLNTDNKFAELEDKPDDEVIFKGAEQEKKNDSKSASTQVSEMSNEKEKIEKSKNSSNEDKETNKNAEDKTDSDKPKNYTRKELVYLVGDSISGQVNPAILGKSTRTYVNKLKASKVEDLHSLTEQVKDAKMIIINTGINNLRGKELAAEVGKSLIESITSFREAAPESKIVVSKVIPIGDHEIDIDRNLFNAQNEKKLTEINKSEISFIDHGNPAERGKPIKDYYRPDFVHLEGQGVAVFAENLEKEISRVLKKGELRLQTGSETKHNGGRDTNGLDKYNERGDRNQRPYMPMNNGNDRYRRQHFHPEGRDQRYSIDRGYQPRAYPGNRGLSGYPSRNDNWDTGRQYYRNYDRGDERNYNRNDHRDNDGQYYRSEYNKDTRGYDTQKTFNSGNYSRERFDERD